MFKIYIISLSMLLSFSLSAQEIASDDFSLEDLMSMETEVKADIGSREGAQNFLNSKAAVDVISAKQIERSGLNSLVDVLRYFVPSFNAPETSVADGTDHVREYTLRGMSPDQILVLINGKRVHTSALLHANETLGRGTSHVDLDTIALSAIDKVEILRDGAAAQYGSDAISGVINISLKAAGHTDSIGIHGGKRAEGDGTQLFSDTFISLPLQYDGFFNITLQAKQQDRTNRGGVDNRLETPVVSTYVGSPESESFATILNSEVVMEDNTILYFTSTMNYRDSTSNAFYRIPSEEHQGFLPLFNAKVLDYSFILGAKGEFGDGYSWDLSNRYGSSNIKQSLNNSMNYSQGSSSLSSYNTGEVSFIQNTTNLDIKKSYNKLNLAAGLEYRYEDYQIKAGEYNSYAGSGSQGYSGYEPENEVDENRNSYAAYLDATYSVSKDFSTEAALRYENYSDFGDTTNVKLAFSYKVSEELLVRSSTSTGFRAPSLAQSDYSKTSSYAGVPVGIFKPNDELVQQFGAKALKPEKSKHFSIGSVYQFSNKTFFMLDYFYIQVKDKILSSNIFLLSEEEQEAYGVAGSIFFTNGLDTQTQGIDIKFQTQHTFTNSAFLDFSIWYNYSNNKVTSIDGNTITAEESIETIDLIEKAQAKHKIKFLTTHTMNKLESTLNINGLSAYYATKMDSSGVPKSYKFNPQWTVDLDIAYAVTEKLRVALGGHNIFDTSPNTWDGLSGDYYGYNGIKQYSRWSPFGYSGAYYYLRAKYEF